MMFWVSLNGTFSGVSSVLPWNRWWVSNNDTNGKLTFSNRQLKSTWTISPVLVSKRIFSPCRSPSLQGACSANIKENYLIMPYPRINPTIDMTAAVRPYVNLLANHAVGSGKVSINHSWKTGIKLVGVSHHGSVTKFYPHIDKIFSLKVTPASWSVISLTRLKYSAISPDWNHESIGEARTREAWNSYPAFYTPCFIIFDNYRSDRDSVRDPLDKTTLLIERYNAVRSDV